MGTVRAWTWCVSDEELTELALAAAPTRTSTTTPCRSGRSSPPPICCPSWYMPASAGHAEPGWRRRIALVVVGAILLINAAGLCVTYGPVTFG